MVIKRVSPMSCAKVLGLLYALFGFLIGAGLSLFMMVIGNAISSPPDFRSPMSGHLFGALFGAGAIIMLPLFYGVLGFVGGAISALVYNMIAGMIGGLEIDVE